MRDSGKMKKTEGCTFKILNSQHRMKMTKLNISQNNHRSYQFQDGNHENYFSMFILFEEKVRFVKKLVFLRKE